MWKVAHTVLDGAVSELNGTNLDLTRPFASFAVFNVGSHLQEFGAGPKGYGRMVAREMDVALEETYDYGGGRLLVGHKVEVDIHSRLESRLTLAVWEGDSYSTKTFIYNGTTADIVAVLDQFRLNERPSGIEVRPRNASRVTLSTSRSHAPTLVQNVPGMGLLEVKELSPKVARWLPRWEGHRVRGGEMFVEGRRSPEMTFLLVGSASVTRLYPNWWEASETQILDRFSGVSVEWQRPI